MSFLGGLGSEPTFMTPRIFWALLLVTLTVGIGIGIGRFIAVRKAKAEAEARRALALRNVPLTCRMNGHAYGQHANGWRCATCGNYISRREGELYGLAEDGRIDRRRHPR